MPLVVFIESYRKELLLTKVGRDYAKKSNQKKGL